MNKVKHFITEAISESTIFLKEIYWPKTSTCFWFVLGYFFLYKYLANKLFFSIEDDYNHIAVIFTLMIFHAIILKYTTHIDKDHCFDISILHFLNIFVIILELGSLLVYFIYRIFVKILTTINNLLDDV